MLLKDRERRRREQREKELLAKLPRRYHQAHLEQLKPALREALAAWPANPTGLYLYGPPGTGKTHAAAALLRAAWFDEHGEDDAKQWCLSWAMWANTALLLEGLRRAMRSKQPETEEQIDHLCRAPLAVLDDLGSEKPSEWVADRLYVVIQHRYDNDLPVVVTSNLSVGEIGERIGARIASRLVEMCQQIELGGPDRRLGAA